MADLHIHSFGDGRGVRQTFVNDRLVNRCFYADEKRGVAKVFLEPLRLDRHAKKLLSRTLHGRVTVVFEGKNG